jgi:hypothetical protein
MLCENRHSQSASQRLMMSCGHRRTVPVRAAFILFIAGLVLTGCDGPNAKGGEKQDKADAAANGSAYSGPGPNERIGRAVDRADRAAQNARDASATAVRKQGDSIQQQANIGATRLDEQAKAMRSAADQRAAALEANANKAAAH